MNTGSNEIQQKIDLPPGQQLVGSDKWPLVGERSSADRPPTWHLLVHGLVEQPIRWTIEELKKLPNRQVTLDIHCVTRWSKLGMSFTGVRLADVLNQSKILPSAKFVSFQSCSSRGHSSSLDLETACGLETLIVWAVDGQGLSTDHGGPLRNIVPNRYFYKSIKWLDGIELLSEDRLGYWEAEAGYHNLADPWLEQRYIAADIDKRLAKQLVGTRQFSGLDLRGIQLAGMDLSDLVATDAKLRDANFRDAQLLGADFTRANLSNAHFENANLEGANFQNADLEGANFCGAILTNCRFEGASLFGASFVAESWRESPPTATHVAILKRLNLTPQQMESMATCQIDFFSELHSQ